ncbi:MAG: hypothetical protein JXA67_07405 [Micromonosporaceae bacterium]|nr:hypothetical protein [Micromonosporaceae bacterium]
MNSRIAANTDELRKSVFDDYLARVKDAAAGLAAVLDANSTAVPKVRCSTDKDISDLLTEIRPIGEKVMKGLEGITANGANGVLGLADMFDKLEEANEKLGYDDDIVKKHTSVV